MSEAKNILAIDTATARLVLGMSYGPDRMVKSDNRVVRTHGQVILKKIDELFKSSGLAKQQLHAVAVSRGPGSFTGLRIGLAVAKGLAVALNIPVYGMTLFELAAFKWRTADEERNLIIPSRKDEYYVGKISNGQIVEERTVRLDNRDDLDLVKSARIFTLETKLPVPTNGDSANLSGTFEYDGTDLIELGRYRIDNNDPDDPISLEPVYYQKAIAEIRFDQRQGN